MTWPARLVRDERGGTALEFAIVATAFFLTVLGTIEFGRLLFFRSALSGAVSASTRELLLDASADASLLETVVLAQMPSAAADRLTVTVTDVTQDGIDFQRVSAAYNFEFILDTLFDFQLNLTEEVTVPRNVTLVNGG